MRILLLSQGRKIEDQISFHTAFKNSTVDGSPVELRNIPFIGFIEQFGLPAFYDEVLRVNREFAPDVVMFQACHWRPLKDPSSCILALRNAANHPLIFGTCGDLFQPYYGHMWVRKPFKPMTIIATMADAFL